MTPIILHNKNEIATYFQKNVQLHLYSIGDLDDFFWPYTIWHAAKQNGQIQAIILLYTGLPLPTLLALSDDFESLQALLQSILHLLPARFYAHLQVGLEKVLDQQFHLEPHGEHYKMGLMDKSRLVQINGANIVRLSADDAEAVRYLYDVSYPGNWFDARMLETGQYFGYKNGSELVSIAGVHVYSPIYKVAALGNITTHPQHRGRGLGQAVTAKLCLSLSETVDHIGLNVKADNYPAISMYEKLGFKRVCPYGEYMVSLK